MFNTKLVFGVMCAAGLFILGALAGEEKAIDKQTQAAYLEKNFDRISEKVEQEVREKATKTVTSEVRRKCSNDIYAQLMRDEGDSLKQKAIDKIQGEALSALKKQIRKDMYDDVKRDAEKELKENAMYNLATGMFSNSGGGDDKASIVSSILNDSSLTPWRKENLVKDIISKM